MAKGGFGAYTPVKCQLYPQTGFTGRFRIGLPERSLWSEAWLLLMSRGDKGSRGLGPRADGVLPVTLNAGLVCAVLAGMHRVWVVTSRALLPARVVPCRGSL